MARSIERVKAVWRIPERGLVFSERFRRALAFEQHVRKHFAGGHGQGVHAIGVFAVRRGALRLQGFVGFAFGELHPGLGFELPYALVASFVSMVMLLALLFCADLDKLLETLARGRRVPQTGGGNL